MKALYNDAYCTILSFMNLNFIAFEIKQYVLFKTLYNIKSY